MAAMSMADPVTGRFTAEIEEIADEMGSSVSTVIRATKILEEAGLLQVARSHRKPNTYALHVE
nr:helix-turn-helix domain-containing protein [Methylobacterium sp. 10]